MSISRYLAAASFCLVVCPATAQDSFGNASIITLTKAGMGPEVLLAKISSLPCSYDLSINSLLELKQGGVADNVIAAMVDRCTGASKSQGNASENSAPSVKRTPGLYINMGAEPAYKLVKIRPSGASGGRITGNGSILFPFRANLAIPRDSAQVVSASSVPHFYFYFENDDAKVGDFGTSATAAAQSPSEFSLLQFKQKKGQREFVVGKQNAFGGSVGIDPKEAISFSVNEVGDSIFEVAPNAALKAGEYGFVLKAGSDSYRVYDFRIP